jgi:tRNA threonylcarbamoyladenosine biosynthesis protein TsaE
VLRIVVYTYISTSVADTNYLARQLADVLVPGNFIALEGDLAAGKTTFSQAFASAIGVLDTVNSPTFTIIKEYEGSRLPFYHMDVYRISLEEAEELGLEDYFYGEGITLVEWASRIQRLLPMDRLDIEIRRTDEHTRVIHIQPYGTSYEEVCSRLGERGIWEK